MPASTVRETLTLQRALLAPMLPGTDAVAALYRADPDWLLATITRHGLAGLWFDYLATTPDAAPALASLLEELRVRKIAGMLLAHRLRAVLDRIHPAFEERGIRYLAFKGLQFADLIYPDTNNRPGNDLDLLVHREDRARAVGAICAMGLPAQPNRHTISHECIFDAAGLEIDLHWHLVRPGRTRNEIADELLATARETHGYRAPDTTGSVLIMLIHPLLTGRPFADDFKLIRFVDLAFALRSLDPDWERILRILRDNGIEFVAWLMLTWCRQLTDQGAPDAILRQLAPGPVRRTYLRRWTDHRLPDWVIHNRAPSLLGFSLPLYRRCGDAVHAILGAYRVAREAEADMHALQQTCDQATPQ